MTRLRLASLCLFVALVPAGAYAQQQGQKEQKKPAAAPAKTEGGAPAAPRVKNYDFDADLIDGELVKPEGEFLNARKFAVHGSLIRVRTDFIREIVKSAEDL